MGEVALDDDVPLALGGAFLAHVHEGGLDHDEDVVVPLGIEHGDVLVEGVLLQGVDVLGQVEVVLAPLLELVVEALEHPHYGGVGLDWNHDATM